MFFDCWFLSRDIHWLGYNMLLFSLLDDEDGGFTPRYSIFSPYSKERFNDRCLRRGLTALDSSRQCSGQIHTQVFSNSQQVAQSIGKKLFDSNQVKQVRQSEDELSIITTIILYSNLILPSIHNYQSILYLLMNRRLGKVLLLTSLVNVS